METVNIEVNLEKMQNAYLGPIYVGRSAHRKLECNLTAQHAHTPVRLNRECHYSEKLFAESS